MAMGKTQSVAIEREREWVSEWEREEGNRMEIKITNVLCNFEKEEREREGDWERIAKYYVREREREREWNK
jgi:hypothetical protein